MTLIPRSLFWRLALLLLAVVAIALAATILFFRHDRATLLARAFSDTKIVQLQAVRAALESSDANERRETVARIGREYGVRIIPERERPLLGAGAPVLPAMQELEAQLRDRLGPGTQVRAAPGRGLLFIRVDAGDAGYWIGFPLHAAMARQRKSPRARSSGAFRSPRCCSPRPSCSRVISPGRSRELAAAAERVGRGETPPPLPEHGPSEIANLNRGFNRMTASLHQLEEDRALLLAGVSHDLRTPLARLRLGLEMGSRDEAMRAGMVDDIEEMDRIIGQFLDFARSDHEAALEPHDPNEIVRACVERYARNGAARALHAGSGAADRAASDGAFAPRRQPDRQRARLRRAAGRGLDVTRGSSRRTGRRRPRSRHRAR